MKKLVSEFKEFAMRGNVMDMAVGVVIGAAFGKIVSSLVADIITPVLSLVTGRINLTALAVTVPAALKGTEPIMIRYGNFLQTVLDFIAVAFSIFLVIKASNRLKRKKEEAPPAAPEISREEALLTEIRDLLKKEN
ncbi:large-conductance mechanosensitive channel protein MscL [Caproiciproducens sp. CPB-2]|uniref:large-conductance mechanosensitive channel protein MscL n=1 Tax=Caproiciproducens sp. CPB-2 TaxID=3030017 RepID=UPI0023DBB30C|nr:large-conductance mechanosensitive channel protein MscL [Caproiciproducens sp. CPB-2]MDF1494500.1 large-conductance mechanosensitive channel protein MscL [Caproiciproducens sp. CPB-2]